MWVLWEELLGVPAVSFMESIPVGFCSQMLWGLRNPGLGDLVWYSSLLRYHPKFLSTTHGVGSAHSASAPLLPVWMDVVSLIS